MWEPRRLTTLRASTACYRDSFTFTLIALDAAHLQNELPITVTSPGRLLALPPTIGKQKKKAVADCSLQS
jgi:hypothetical protein